MKRNTWLLIAAFALLAVAFFVASLDKENSANASTNSNKFPHFKIKDLDGKEINSETLSKGKVTIVNFWATWCPPCRKEIPHFVELQKKHKDKVIFIGVSVDRDSEEVVKKWTVSNKVNYPVGKVDNKFQDPYQLLLPEDMRGGIPYTFILDNKGNLVDKLVGYREMDYWEKAISKYSAN